MKRTLVRVNGTFNNMILKQGCVGYMHSLVCSVGCTVVYCVDSLANKLIPVKVYLNLIPIILKVYA